MFRNGQGSTRTGFKWLILTLQSMWTFTGVHRSSPEFTDTGVKKGVKCALALTSQSYQEQRGSPSSLRTSI